MLIIVAVLFALFPSALVAKRFATFVIMPAAEFVTTIVMVATFELLSVPMLQVTNCPDRVQDPTVDEAEP